MANIETTKIYEAAKDVLEDFYNNSVDNDQVARFIAEDISLAIAERYGKGFTAKYIMDQVSYHVQSWCNPVLNSEDC